MTFKQKWWVEPGLMSCQTSRLLSIPSYFGEMGEGVLMTEDGTVIIVIFIGFSVNPSPCCLSF